MKGNELNKVRCEPHYKDKLKQRWEGVCGEEMGRRSVRRGDGRK